MILLKNTEKYWHMIDEVEAEVFEFNKYVKIFITHSYALKKKITEKNLHFSKYSFGFPPLDDVI